MQASRDRSSASRRLFGVASPRSPPYNPGMSSQPTVNPEADALAQWMEALGVREEDLEETFVRSGGHGGQNVNKVSTCVQLLHRPSGLQVRCQTTRYQGRNRELARYLLCEKLEALKKSAMEMERARIEKQRRAKRGRSYGAKQRILADKSHQSKKKANRRGSRED